MSPAGRSPLPAPQRAASILAAAARAFRAGGFAGTTIDDVAAEAGITKLIVYRHFGSKHALYTAVLDQVGEALTAAARSPGAEPGSADPVEQASAALLAYLRAARAQPDAFRLLVTHAAHEPEFAAHARAVRERGLPDAERALAVVPDPVRRRWAARTIGACVDAAVLGWLDLTESEQDPGDADMALRLARMLGAIAGAAL